MPCSPVAQPESRTNTACSGPSMNSRGVDGVRYESAWPEPTAGAGQSARRRALDCAQFPRPADDPRQVPGATRAALRDGQRDVRRGACRRGRRAGVPGRRSRRRRLRGRTLADQVAVDAPRVFHAHRRVSTSTAASGICITYFTSIHALKQRAQLRARRDACSCWVRRAASGPRRSSSAS